MAWNRIHGPRARVGVPRATSRRSRSAARHSLVVSLLLGTAIACNPPIYNIDAESPNDGGTAGARADGGESGNNQQGGTSGRTSRTSGGTSSGGSTAAGGTPTGGGSTAAGGTSTGGASTATGGTSTGGASTAAGGTSTGGASTATGGTSTGGASTATGGTSTGGASTSSPSFCVGTSQFCDDFEDGNALGWTALAGTWTVVDSSQSRHYSTTGSATAIADNTQQLTDQTIEAKVTANYFPGTGSSYRAGLITRATSGSTFFGVMLDASATLRLYRGGSTLSNASGTCGNLATLANATSQNALSMTTTGAPGSIRITTYLNGVMQHDCTTTTSTYQAVGAAGLIVVGTGTLATFDDVRVTKP